MHRKLLKNTGVVLLVTAAVSLSALAVIHYRSLDDCPSVRQEHSRWELLRNQWANQRVIMVMRHTTKCDDELPDCINGNEILTEKGIQEAISIGFGFRDGLPGNYQVRHSPLDRTRDTAMLAFRQSTPDMALAKPCKYTFPDYVQNLAMPANQILVTHSSCLNSLRASSGERLLGFNAGKDPHFGVAAFLERTDQADNLIGCMWPKDWDGLQQRKNKTI